MFYQIKQLIIFGCLILFWGSCTNEDKFDSFFNEALRMEKRENYQEALYFLDKAIDVDSTKSFVYVIRGKVKSLLNDENGAIGDFKHALILNPINTAAYFHYGISLAILGKHDSALLLFDSAIRTKLSGDFVFEIKTENLGYERLNYVELPVIKYFKALSFYKLKRFHEAEKEFQFSLSNKNNVPECQFYLGLIFLEKQQLTTACYFFNEAKNNGLVDANEYVQRYCGGKK